MRLVWRKRAILKMRSNPESDMKAKDLIKKTKFILDSDGKRKAVQLDYATWEELLEFLKDVEDAEIARVLDEVYAEVDSSLDPALYTMQQASIPKGDW